MVYGFTLLFLIYKEQGYSEREIPELILTHNLYGLDIDERAAQLARFAVLMKARAINSRIFRKSISLNITVVRPMNRQMIPQVKELKLQDWYPLIEAFKDADNLGSLITPPKFNRDLLQQQLDLFEQHNPLLVGTIPGLRQLLFQADLLRKKYWVVVANPPYMGSGSFNDVVKKFINKKYKAGKGDLYACYILRNLKFCTANGSLAMLTIPNWMFLSSFEDVRKFILENAFLESLVHNGRGVFGSDFGSCSFVIRQKINKEGIGVFKRLFDKQGSVASNEELEQRYFKTENYYTKPADFAKIPGSAIAYWVSPTFREIFEKYKPLSKVATPRQGLSTSDNNRFIRYWIEVNITNIVFRCPNQNYAKETGLTWFPIDKGGGFRKWYGNNDFIVNWKENGEEIKELIINKYSYLNGNPDFVAKNPEYYFLPGITWGKITSGAFSARETEEGYIFSDAGMKIFHSSKIIRSHLLGLLNSKITEKILHCLSPTLNFEQGNISKIPVRIEESYKEVFNKLVNISRQDWDNFETSWDFQTHPLLRYNTPKLSEAFKNWQTDSENAFQQLKQLEEENNKYWIEAYGLQDELTPEVPDDQITIRRADPNRDICSLISYAIGCLMGRYSLDKPGLIHAGQPFDPTQHTIFAADIDAIIPITDQAYFEDDIVNRFIEFISIAYSPQTLTENLDFIADTLTRKSGETSRDRIRRYFLTEFISNHIQTYKKRPIYWLFTSGKNRAFNALVYLHRYSPDTLARLRTDYVLQLQVKLDGEISRTQNQFENGTTSAAKKAATKRLKQLQTQQLELRDYQALLQTKADARIQLDLDDGVAYNYTRFKGLVYEGSDLKMADLEKAAKWKLELLKQEGK